MRNLNKHLLQLDRSGQMNYPTHAEAQRLWVDFRRSQGIVSDCKVPLLSAPDSNAKLKKGSVPIYGLSLAPATVSGEYNTCSWSTALCRKGCLNTAGKGELDRVQRGRKLKTLFLGQHPGAFLTLLDAEITKAEQKHKDLRVRLNVLSDLEWERFASWIFSRKYTTKFYDYTKSEQRALLVGTTLWPQNYRLVFSASERVSDAEVKELLQNHVSVSMVFDRVPEQYMGIPVVCGDDHDDRWAEPHGSLIGLKGKGRMRQTETYIPFIRKAL